MKKLKDNIKNSKNKKIIIKSIFGILLGISAIILVYLITLPYKSGKIIGFISYFFLASVSLFEFTRIFPLPRWAKYYFPLLTFISFFFPWEILNQWLSEINSSIGLKTLILSQYQFGMFGIPGLGYVFLFVLVLFPFLFCKKYLIETIKLYFITFVFILMMLTVGKIVLFINVEDIYLLLLLLGVPILCDIFGYLAGSSFGTKIFKKKLAPKISPNKTFEGAIVGFVIGWSFSFVIFWFIKFNEIMLSREILISVIPILLPIISIIGDLLFSYAKRINKVKDYSDLIPGHGGVIDRIDSIFLVLFAVPPIILCV